MNTWPQSPFMVVSLSLPLLFSKTDLSISISFCGREQSCREPNLVCGEQALPYVGTVVQDVCTKCPSVASGSYGRTLLLYIHVKKMSSMLRIVGPVHWGHSWRLSWSPMVLNVIIKSLWHKSWCYLTCKRPKIELLGSDWEDVQSCTGR